jgi:hypothetical protein
MRRPTQCAAVVALFLILAGAGCSPSGMSTVTGEVTLDGEPLKEGLIRFIPPDGAGPTADATISDGHFKATVPPGAKRVEISASRVVGKRKMYDTPDSPVADEVKERLPARYNVKSELTMTVEKGNQEKRFELTSKNP